VGSFAVALIFLATEFGMEGSNIFWPLTFQCGAFCVKLNRQEEPVFIKSVDTLSAV
jgi:hypothetical protein